MRSLAATGVLIGACCLPMPLAAITSQTLVVNATVAAGCLVVGGVTSYGTLDFGSYANSSTSTVVAQMPSTGVRLQCTPGVALNMTVDGGQYNASGRRLQRSGGTQQVGYQLFRDAGLSQALPIGQSVAVVYSDATNISLPIYGRLVLPGNLPSGQYSDVLQVQLSW